MSDLSEVLERCEQMLLSMGSLSLATLDAVGTPSLSYTPFIYHKGAFYILVSQLAEHTAHLKAQPKASVMLIADESETRNIYARQRLIVQIKANSLGPVTEQSGSELLTVMEDKLGNTVSLLKTLSDFELFELKLASDVRYVEGFGRAYDVNLENKTASQVAPEK